jgi:hypothetical protein
MSLLGRMAIRRWHRAALACAAAKSVCASMVVKVIHASLHANTGEAAHQPCPPVQSRRLPCAG